MSAWVAAKRWPAGEPPAFITGIASCTGLGSLHTFFASNQRPSKSNSPSRVQIRRAKSSHSVAYS